ncbi:putative KR domain containing protein [Lyophyllum shimeji]|uniref:KR domain containing protein n=1 Tax=Lyophyllum shimeji TaxID=47721 RepID=A0A9P3PFL0_LYOSH|nr:putative KR domain containing protein [Lyophyllum shimeji]
MSTPQVITAYPVAIPHRQRQELPGLDKNMKPGVEHTKLEAWKDDGTPVLVEYKGSGKLEGKTAIITGGDSGIGRAAAIMFAREGCKGITISHLPQEAEDAKDAKAAIEAAGAKVNLVSGDLTVTGQCKALVDSHMKEFGKLNILVNNASKQIQCEKLEDIDLNQVEHTFRSNILQMFAVTKFALPHMNRGSSIINTTSVTAYKGYPTLVDYSSTKGAIVSFTRSLAVQLAKRGIRANAVAPGVVITPLQAATRSEEEMEGLGVGMPLHNRGGQPAELGPAYVFLASYDSNLMTGQVIHINAAEHIGDS